MFTMKITKTYFFKILFSFIITILITIILFSLILYSNFEQSSAAVINKLNQEFLSETYRLNEYVERMIKISGMELFYEPSIQKIMYQPDIANFDVVQAIRRLDSIRSMNPHTHSIYVYNNEKEYIYTNSHIDSNTVDKFFDSGASALLSFDQDIKRLAPIPRYINEDGNLVPIYSFVFYQHFVQEPHYRGALIINIGLDWLHEILGNNDQSEIYFIAPDGVVMYHSEQEKFLSKVSDTPFFKTMISKNTTDGYFIEKRGGKKFLVFYTFSADSNLYLTRIYEYDILMKGIISMRRNTLFISFLFLIITTIASFILSRRLYAPIKGIVKKFDTDPSYETQNNGEISFLSSSIDQMVLTAASLQETTTSYLKALQIDILKDVILGKVGDYTQLQQQWKEYSIPLSLTLPFYVVGIKSKRESMVTLFDEVSPLIIPFDNNSYLYICQDISFEVIRAFALSFAQEEYTKMVLVSNKIFHITDITQHSLKLLESLRFSFMYEQNVVYFQHEITRSIRQGNYSAPLEKQLLASLHKGDKEEAYATYKLFFLDSANDSFNHFRFSMKRLYISIQLLVQEFQRNDLFETYRGKSINEFESFIDSLEDAKILHEYMWSICEQFYVEVVTQRLIKSQLHVSVMKNIIEKDYANQNMCIQYVCDNTELSPSYVSKLFKTHEGISINDYILEVRITKAKELLQKEEYTIKEVAALVGFSTENYFYAVFKKYTGETPAKYRRGV
ncbi:MAG: AraC family transcriptional regulator [Spirochaetia bacterium]|nr:AraC family transcriptional regulator [Spirochaetia bacterium]